MCFTPWPPCCEPETSDLEVTSRHFLTMSSLSILILDCGLNHRCSSFKFLVLALNSLNIQNLHSWLNLLKSIIKGRPTLRGSNFYPYPVDPTAWGGTSLIISHDLLQRHLWPELEIRWNHNTKPAKTGGEAEDWRCVPTNFMLSDTKMSSIYCTKTICKGVQLCG